MSLKNKDPQCLAALFKWPNSHLALLPPPGATWGLAADHSDTDMKTREDRDTAQTETAGF